MNHMFIFCQVKTEGGKVRFPTNPVCYDWRQQNAEYGNVNIIKSKGGQVDFNNFPHTEDTKGELKEGALVWFNIADDTGYSLNRRFTTSK